MYLGLVELIQREAVGDEPEASAVLESRPLLRYVENVQVTAPGAADRQLPDGVLVEAGELVQLGATPLVAYDSGGQSYSSEELP
jgi:hypothetical protein